MTAHSFTHSRYYRFISLVLCLTVLAASIPQQGWVLLFGVQTAYAASTETNHTSMLPASPSYARDLDKRIVTMLSFLNDEFTLLE